MAKVDNLIKKIIQFFLSITKLKKTLLERDVKFLKQI